MSRAAITFTFLSLSVILAAGAQTPLKVEGLPGDAPLAVTASATAEKLTVDVSMDPEWHLYATDVGGGQPVSISVAKHSAWGAAGALKIPAGEGGRLKGTFRLELPLEFRGPGRGLAARFEFMACDPLACLPPMSVELTGKVERPGAAPRVLVVVDVRDGRSGRLSKLLLENGFTVAVETYEKVTAERCDAHDVVLADSKLFRKYEKGALARAREFPRTKSPIVAVGLLGTELIEKHGIAMTSGYI